jgi:hypothetical protein
LVVKYPSWKIWVRQLGRMTSHIWWKIKTMFETTSQYNHHIPLCCWFIPSLTTINHHY